ncbi:hypothetical protein CLV98_10667 [Dyadobacter jejuensis]|uniref:Uncharacterized protein n=1 Tax=Dyadobacter jejuensis TaxID=1082580 RepID=A0A316AIS4_9BACT|nr:hypothetical protein CLV98_10667 [Dyadobacter jejuensis]
MQLLFSAVFLVTYSIFNNKIFATLLLNTLNPIRVYQYLVKSLTSFWPHPIPPPPKKSRVPNNRKSTLYPEQLSIKKSTKNGQERRNHGDLFNEIGGWLPIITPSHLLCNRPLRHTHPSRRSYWHPYSTVITARRKDVSAGEPLSVTSRMTWKTVPLGASGGMGKVHSIFSGFIGWTLPE